jgi:hypothetical protein
MKTARGFLIGLAAAAALFLAAGGSSVHAVHTLPPKPLLNCADVTGDGPVSISDVVALVARFGSNDPTWTANASYHPLYDLATAAGGGSITISDVVVAVSDFGLSCASLSPVDTEIARATLALLNAADPPGGAACPGSALLTMNQTCLQEHGYYQASFDVPGQGFHWVNATYFEDDVFDTTKPEGVVYTNNRLAAELYFVDGYAVGWGPEPPPIENVDIDQFCTPTPPTDQCSWAQGYDGWHLHQNLCTYNIGTPFASNWITPNALACEELHNSTGHGGTWRWQARVGWMGHMWNFMLNANPNPLDVNGNGRFADCFPDTEHWTGFNCPQ